ncbi:non-ribosomal peptide synthetase [Streptomyces benahoarensis]|uniref:Non-ribosomal peptide synthetase n=1 Tax=Streptomyces benahoarensis TaxID=2595054 RepID=A0A553ZQA4_9ACTN|nr:non-ribosomal peptide synthetase [Streptomyces benahoarensis]TSB43661.1 non-ribosomal peptide synthetase [Streptomyces benahoarensis]
MRDSAGENGAAAGRNYWRKVLDAGGFTPLPAWAASARPERGLGEYRAALPAGADVTSSVLLAVHAKVVAALTGDRGTVIGFQPAARPSQDGPLPARVSVEGGTWQELIGAADRTRRDILRYAAQAPQPAEHAGRALLDTMVAERTGELPPGVVLAVSADGGALVVRHRTEVLDHQAAVRIAGYFTTALRRITENPADAHDRKSLLSADELHVQTVEFAGAEEPLPDRRFHELFEDRVRRHPHAVAAVQGGRRVTYEEVNRQANRVAWALRRSGLGDEDVVAVLTERNLAWLGAVIGVFKAGGVYLPIEPNFPAARISAMLDRSACRYALTEHGPAPVLDQVRAAPLPGHRMEVIRLDELSGQDLPDHNPRLPVAGDQLAYIYFTSGSTGEPKGAMCEHAGFSNHLLAKIEDLGVGEGGTVAQVAPQCFDISLWQLVSALLVGGTTHIVEQEVVLDIGRFVDTLRTGRVEVAQLVPSYLEVLLAHLEGRQGQLPDLRCVSVTGEALKKELVERWFAAFPDVALVNAYGLTETSDDTNHEVMRRVPDGLTVPLGRPVRNVRVHVVDEHLDPVPLGAPGEIVFSGVCVGRGYINDEARTKETFLPDPSRPGERLYRSGDFGRWTPDGRLEFHGRRDSQLKIRGFRIETSEIENRLLQVAGVRDAAVVAAGSGEGRYLVGYYAAPDGPEPQDVRARLAGSLPEYMVPARLVQRDALPLTPNGKIDKKTLAAQATGADEAPDHPGKPRTDSERRIAGAWSQALKVPVERILRTAHFYETGGTSLTAVRLAVALDGLVSLKEIAEHPVLADLAELLDRRLAEQDPAAAVH